MTTAEVGPIVNDRVRSYGFQWADYNNDGWPDLWVGTILWTGNFAADGHNFLYRNEGNGSFSVITNTSITSSTLAGGAGVWGDYDNDGFLDLFVAGYTSGNKLFRNNGDGSFTRVTTGSIANDRPLAGAGSYTGMWFDYDRNGFLDLYVGNGEDYGSLNTANFLYRNNPNGNHWLQVRLAGTTSNPKGIGAKVRAQARLDGRLQWQRRDITAGDFYNGNNLYADFGLGNATNVVTLRIEWPSGTVQELTNVPADQILTITEPRRPVLTVAVTPAGVTGTITGDPNTGYEIDVSDDLATGWTLLTTATTGANGTTGWSDPGPAPQGRRFYKAGNAP
jgi:hypothetical protein